MAKRLTDTGKWDRANFQDLPSKMKLAQTYLYDKCDHAGIWIINIRLMSFQIGEKYTEDELFKCLGSKLYRFGGDKAFIPGFIEFQYGTLKDDCSLHKRVLRTLTDYGLVPVLEQYLQTGSVANHSEATVIPLCSQGGDTLQREREEERERKGGVGEKQNGLDFEALYAKYPHKVGKSPGLKIARAQIKTPEDYAKLEQAIANFSRYHEKRGTEKNYIPYFKTFMGQWRDWIEAPEDPVPHSAHLPGGSASAEKPAYTGWDEASERTRAANTGPKPPLPSIAREFVARVKGDTS
jgi:hypothetical protein